MRRITVTILFVCLSGILTAVSADKEIIRVGPDLKLPFSPAVKAGNFIYVAGSLATDDTGRVIPGDIKAQTQQVLENASRILQAAGSSLENVAAVHVYLTNVSDFPGMNEVYQKYWPKDPPARTTVAGNLVLPGAIVEMSMVAIPKGGERKVIHPADWLKTPLPYSYGILSGDTLFLAGLVSRSGKDNSPVPGDMKAQVKTTMDNAGEILKAAGMGYGDVVSSRVYITDAALFQDMNAVYRSYFSKDPPARATVKTALASPQYMVEITMVAVRGGAREAITPPSADGTPGQINPNLSSAIRVGNRLYLSGVMGNTPSNQSDIRGQTRETLVRLGRTLKASGFEWDQVVDAIVYITDVKNFAGMNEAYREIFAKDFPARATIETGLVNPEGLVEIMFVAVK
jgi:2-iminobutanoate/2-iminopropanoate deaminase